MIPRVGAAQGPFSGRRSPRAECAAGGGPVLRRETTAQLSPGALWISSWHEHGFVTPERWDSDLGAALPHGSPSASRHHASALGCQARWRPMSVMLRGDLCTPLPRGRPASPLRCVLTASGASLCARRGGRGYLRACGGMDSGGHASLPRSSRCPWEGVAPVLRVDQGLVPRTHGVMPEGREAKVRKVKMGTQWLPS